MPSAFPRAGGLGVEPGLGFRHQALHQHGEDHRDDRHVEQPAPAVVRQDPAGQQGGDDIAHRPAGLQGAEHGGAVAGRYVFGHQGVAGDIQRAQPEGGEEAGGCKLPVAVGQTENRSAYREQHDAPHHGLDPTKAVAGPASINPADRHPGQGETAQAAGLDTGQAELGLQAAEAVGQEHQVCAIDQKTEEAEDEDNDPQVVFAGDNAPADVATSIAIPCCSCRAQVMGVAGWNAVA